MKISFFILTVLLFTFSGCKKDAPLIVNGQLKNLTGLDACGWVIQLEQKGKNGSDKLEPRNLNAFKIKLEDGKDVVFSYHELQTFSSCMVGTIVELESIKVK